MLAYVMLVITALGIALSQDVVQLLFGFVGVGQAALDQTGVTLAIFLVGLTAHSLIAVLARAFYALQDTATPVVAALIAVGVNIVVASVLVGPLGLERPRGRDRDGRLARDARARRPPAAPDAVARASGGVGGVMLRTAIVAVAGGASRGPSRLARDGVGRRPGHRCGCSSGWRSRRRPAGS